MRKRYFLLIVWTVLLTMVLCVFPVYGNGEGNASSNGYAPDLVGNVDFEQRRLQLIQSAAAAVDRTYDAWESAKKGVALLWLEEDVSKANDLLALGIRWNGNWTDSGNGRLYWAMPLLVRAYMLYNHNSGTQNHLMELETEHNILEMIWQFTQDHYYVMEATEDQFNGYGVFWSENHNMIAKSVMLLGSQILKDHPDYEQVSLPDGKTLDTFYGEMVENYKEYLSRLAKTGLLVEVASHNYQQLTMQGLYNIYDFSENRDLRKGSEIILDLLWVDFTQENFTGVRGGAKSRVYGNEARNVRSDGMYAFSLLYFGYGIVYHSHATMFPSTSGYMIPDYVYHLNDDKGNKEYELISRRPGVGKTILLDNGRNTPVYFVDLAESLLRYSYVTPDYIAGSFRKDFSKKYTNIVGQNQWEGITFPNSPNSRLFAFIPTNANLYNTFRTLQNGPVMIMSKTPTIPDNLGNPQLYMTEDIRTGLTNEGDWWFSSIGDAYIAITSPNGGFQTAAEGLEFTNTDQTIVIQMGREAKDGSYEMFKQRVIGNELTFSESQTLYQDGEWGELQHSNIPLDPVSIDSVPVNYSPDLVMDTPYVQSQFGSGEYTVRVGQQLIIYSLRDPDRPMKRWRTNSRVTDFR